jgi:NAD(P)H-dependent flavin oxidoreductase YrpB (nitropropane dioxygenase family)
VPWERVGLVLLDRIGAWQPAQAGLRFSADQRGNAGTLRAVSVLGCEFPLMQAPLGRGAAARLATAVSRAGGLGTLGASWTEPPVLREQIRSIARVTDRPFCVNLVLDFAQDERLELVVEERVPLVSFSFGLRPDLVICARVGGACVLVQVAEPAAAIVERFASALRSG